MAYGFNNIRELVDAEIEGKSVVSYFRKSPVQVTLARQWFDLSIAPTSPGAQYYASFPLTSTVLTQSSNRGMYHGGDVSTGYKYLRSIAMWNIFPTTLSCTFLLLDYLMYYPYIDESVATEQVMTNSSSLTRYTDGEGVQMML